MAIRSFGKIVLFLNGKLHQHIAHLGRRREKAPPQLHWLFCELNKLELS